MMDRTDSDDFTRNESFIQYSNNIVLKETFPNRFKNNSDLNADELYTSDFNLNNCFTRSIASEGKDILCENCEFYKNKKIINIISEIQIILRNKYINSVSTNITEKCHEIVDKRIKIMTFIEDIMLNIVEAEQNGKLPTIMFRNYNDWNNCNYDEIVSLKSTGEAFMKEIKFSNMKSKAKFALIIHLLSKIYKLLQTDATCTKRELYYQNISIVKSQSILESALRNISCLLEVPLYELGILSTSKGLIAGSLTFTTSDGCIIDCLGNGTLIPQDVMKIKTITSTANFILVVEKDAIFQKLLDEGILTRLGPCIIITGKGFPDINTRLLLKRLWVELTIPILALTDADSYGIEIMFVYRFGSLGMSYQAESLTVPSIRWIGIHPSDIVLLNVPHLELNTKDKFKLKDLLKRPYLKNNILIKEQLLVLYNTNAKAEIEAVGSLSNAYLTDIYLPNKICSKDLI